MRCRKAQWMISDEIDGRLAPSKRGSLNKHLETCPSCREYREHLRNLQTKTARVASPAVPSGYWEDSLARLRKKLEAVRTQPGGKERILRPFPALFPRWAWAGAAALLFAGVGLYFVLGPSSKILERLPLSHEDAAGRLIAMIGADESYETEVADLIQASILENTGEEIRDSRLLLYGESRFLDGLSEEELERLETHLDNELKI